MHVQKVFIANGYPKQAVVKKRRKRRDGCQSGWPRARVFLPYIKGMSEKISRACKPLGVQTVFTFRNTLRKSLTKVKGRPGMMDMKGVVYSIPCAKCSATYVRETRRMLRVRMADHRRAVKKKDPLSCMSKKLRIPSTGRKRRSLRGRTIWEEEGFVKPLWSNKGDQWWTWMLVWFWIHRGSPLFTEEGTVTLPEALHQEVQPLFREDILS